ncbi:MAG: DNA polymerase III subunit gamma/tau [Gudongella sp.]|nr:DNA polymerase III subunit gamma/tau [Gudongella sp.]
MYQALYRQYRPKTFDELLGQEHITTILRNQIKKDNVGHAYLFSGTRGTGKTSAAKIFSRAVSCLNPVDGNPCNVCDVCKGILNETLMDVIEMDAASNRKIEDIRDLKEKVVYAPTKARYKVYIIDEVHMLTNEAFNALLKTLEEPPKHLIFILATTEPQRLPQTILSRCQRFDFKRLTAKDMIQGMKSITDSIGIEVEDKVFSLIAKNSDGAMRDALSLLDQCIAFNDKNLNYEDAIKILGIANIDFIFKLVDAIKDGNVEESLQMLDFIIAEGKDIPQFLKDLIHHYRNLMITKTSKNPDMLVDWGEIELYQKQLQKMDLDYIIRSLDLLTEAENAMKWSLQPRIILEMSVIKMINILKEGSLEERIQRLEDGIIPVKVVSERVKPELEKPKPAAKETVVKKELKTAIKKEASEEVKVPKDEDIKETITGELDLQIVKKSWPEVLKIVKAKKMNIYALVTECEVSSVKHDRITLIFKEGYEFHKEALNAPQNKEFLENIISSYYGKKVELLVIMKDCESPDDLEDNKPKVVDQDKAIKEALDFFGEDIVDIK